MKNKTKIDSSKKNRNFLFFFTFSDCKFDWIKSNLTQTYVNCLYNGTLFRNNYQNYSENGNNRTSIVASPSLF